jgi:hypothetical protein
VSALLDALWVRSSNVVAATQALTAAVAAAADEAERERLCAELESNLQVQAGTITTFWLALFGTLLTPEQTVTCYAGMWPWLPTLLGIRSGVQQLQREGAWPP